MKALDCRLPPAIPGRHLALGLLACALVVLPAYSVDVTWRDMSNQEQQDWVIRYDIPGSIRHSTERRSAPAQARRESQGAQPRRESQGAEQRRASQGAQERRASQGASERRTGHASDWTHGYVEDRAYRPLGYYGSVRQDSRR